MIRPKYQKVVFDVGSIAMLLAAFILMYMMFTMQQLGKDRCAANAAQGWYYRTNGAMDGKRVYICCFVDTDKLETCYAFERNESAIPYYGTQVQSRNRTLKINNFPYPPEYIQDLFSNGTIKINITLPS